MKTTLQNRLTILMIASSIVFIVVFSTLQLWGHKQNVDRFLNFKIRQSFYVITETFNGLFQREMYSPEYFKSALERLKSIGIIDQAVVVNKEGNALAKTGFVYYPLPTKTLAEKVLNSNETYSFTGTEKYRYAFVRIPDNLLVSLAAPTSTLQKALAEMMIPIAGIILFVVIANFFLAMFLSKVLITPITMLYHATTEIAKGDLDKRVSINTEDELEELAENFNFMTKELKKMKARAENANPLTKLPGNVVIQEETERRMSAGEKFVVIYCDLDNFKAFNDKYGVHKGDEAIGLTAQIFKESVKNVGGENDFVGHEGGDDFLLVTTPERADRIANYITAEFDKRVRSLYSQEDLDRGYIEAKARHSEEIMKFPIMTISLAGISNSHRPITTYAEITNIAAEVKKKAKSLAGSNFVMDKRID